MIICFEGIDGTGKTTQAKRLAETLGATYWKFPVADSPTGRLIYTHLRKDWSARFPGGGFAREADAMAFQALQTVNRLEVAPILLQEAARGHVVIDRYWGSAYAYGVADGLDAAWLSYIHAGLPQPDLWILLEADVETTSQRVGKRAGGRDRYEANLPHQVKVAEAYAQLWHEAQRAPLFRDAVFVKIDSTQDKDAVATEVKRAFDATAYVEESRP